MKIIAHRGNIDGPNPLTENHPDTIDSAIESGFDVEIDIRYDTLDGQFYLGHDDPQYIVSPYWLAQRMERLWIHCKNLDALYHFVNKTGGYNYFWHQTDDYTLTSKNYIWTYPGQPYTSSSIIVMPESSIRIEDLTDLVAYNCYGICTDYPQRLIK
jgi:glycerophosphoryl diester phosphodiesterase